MPNLLRRLLILLVALPILGLLVLSGDHASSPPPGPPIDAPRAIVALGDSTMSGEGAGNYVPGTDGQNGDWCHRSPDALINHTTVAGISTAINLACSGTNAGAIALHNTTPGAEPSQARQLGAIALKYRVTTIVVAVGANDDPDFGGLITSCLQAIFQADRPGCGQQIDPLWQGKVNAMIPKVVGALRDIRQVMTEDGYSVNAYTLVLQSYAAPVGPDIVKTLQNLSGCPLRTDDLHWVQDKGVPTLDAGMRQAAAQADVRFLDLSQAGTGHEACSNATDPGAEWFTRLALDFPDLQDNARSSHSLQESFHPNVQGYTEFGSCLSSFLATSDKSAACVPDGKGGLRLAAANQS